MPEIPLCAKMMRLRQNDQLVQKYPILTKMKKLRKRYQTEM